MKCRVQVGITRAFRVEMVVECVEGSKGSGKHDRRESSNGVVTSKAGSTYYALVCWGLSVRVRCYCCPQVEGLHCHETRPTGMDFRLGYWLCLHLCSDLKQ